MHVSKLLQTIRLVTLSSAALTHCLKLQSHKTRQRPQAAIIRETQHTIRRGSSHLAALMARDSQLHDAGAIDPIALDGLFVTRRAVLELRQRKVKVRVVVVLPYVRALGRVDDDGAVKDYSDAALGRQDFARAVFQEMVCDVFGATSLLLVKSYILLRCFKQVVGLRTLSLWTFCSMI